MIDPIVITYISKAKEKAEKSVDYTPKDGAVCPECSKKNLRTVTSRPWESGLKIRYHKCTDPDCLLSFMGIVIKSIQVDINTKNEK